MKICLIYDFLTEFGGLEREIVSHARMLKDEGFEVEVLTCFYEPETLKKITLIIRQIFFTLLQKKE
jgi:hypothetical protein